MAWMSQYKLHESRRGLELKFFHNIFSVGFNGVYTQVQLVGHLLVGVLTTDQLENFFFPSGEVKLLEKGIVGIEVLYRQVRAEREAGLPGVNQVNGMIQVLCIAIFQQVAPGTGLHCFGYQVRIVVSTQDNDLDPGILIPDLAGSFQPVHDRHINVYKNNVGKPGMKLVQQFEAIGGDVGDAEGRVSAEKMADSGSEKPVIVRQHDVNRHVRSLRVHE